uniref:Uncharacterized protein n=1 Tax=Anguilla anguilla TaxID=7936 RepID=A0A0E9WCN5_ANGAN
MVMDNYITSTVAVFCSCSNDLQYALIVCHFRIKASAR